MIRGALDEPAVGRRPFWFDSWRPRSPLIVPGAPSKEPDPLCPPAASVSPPTEQQLAAVGYGAPLTIDYKRAIQTFFFDKLKDPLSAQYLFGSSPQKWWTIDYIGGALDAGYAVRFQLNFKNSYGGYVGFRQWLVLFRDNQIVAVTYDGNPWS
jgi:hypothetical protein